MQISCESEALLKVNIENPTEIKLIDVAKEIVEMTGSKSKIIFEPLPIDDPKCRQPDITKAKKLLNWVPEVSRTDGLKKTIEYIQSVLRK